MPSPTGYGPAIAKFIKKMNASGGVRDLRDFAAMSAKIGRKHPILGAGAFAAGAIPGYFMKDFLDEGDLEKLLMSKAPKQPQTAQPGEESEYERVLKLTGKRPVGRPPRAILQKLAEMKAKEGEYGSQG